MTIVLFDNSYVTLEEADDYLDSRSARWVSATEEQKERALVQATSLLDELPWLGQSLTADQPLAWPRSRFSYYDPSFVRVLETTESDVPRRVKTAVFNQALHLVTYPELFEASEVQSYERIKVGPIELEDRDTDSQRSVPTMPYRTVKKIVAPLIDPRYATRTWWRAN
jgi:hypothetical protein